MWANSPYLRHLNPFLDMGNYFSCKSQNQSSSISESIQEAFKWGPVILTLVSLIGNDTAQHGNHQRKRQSYISGFWSHLCAVKKWINFTPKPQKPDLCASCRKETPSRASYPASSDPPCFPASQNIPGSDSQKSFYQPLSLFPHCSERLAMVAEIPSISICPQTFTKEMLSQFIMSPFYEMNVMVVY